MGRSAERCITGGTGALRSCGWARTAAGRGGLCGAWVWVCACGAAPVEGCAVALLVNRRHATNGAPAQKGKVFFMGSPSEAGAWAPVGVTGRWRCLSPDPGGHHAREPAGRPKRYGPGAGLESVFGRFVRHHQRDGDARPLRAGSPVMDRLNGGHDGGPLGRRGIHAAVAGLPAASTHVVRVGALILVVTTTVIHVITRRRKAVHLKACSLCCHRRRHLRSRPALNRQTHQHQGNHEKTAPKTHDREANTLRVPTHQTTDQSVKS